MNDHAEGTSDPVEATPIGDEMTLGRPLVRALAITAALTALAWLADGWVYARWYDPKVYDRDWGRLLRVMGFLGTWLALAVAIALQEGAEPARRALAKRRASLLFWSAALGGLVAEVGKLTIRRERPEPHDGMHVFRDWGERTWSTAGLAMPSSHTLVAFAGAAMLARLYPRARWVGYALAAGCALTRVMARAHFLSDVVLAAGLGWVVAWGVGRRLRGVGIAMLMLLLSTDPVEAQRGPPVPTRERLGWRQVINALRTDPSGSSIDRLLSRSCVALEPSESERVELRRVLERAGVSSKDQPGLLTILRCPVDRRLSPISQPDSQAPSPPDGLRDVDLLAIRVITPELLIASRAAGRTATQLDLSGFEFRSRVSPVPVQAASRVLSPTVALSTMVFSPDGRWIASAKGSTMYLWDVTTGQLQREVTGPGHVRSIAFSPDGRWVAGGFEGSIWIWDAGFERLIRAIPGHGGVTAVAFSPDGRRLAGGNADGRVWVWNIQNLRGGREAFENQQALLPVNSPLLAVGFSPNGRWLASLSDDGIVRIWDVGNGSLVRTLSARLGNVRSFAYSPDGRWLVGGADDGTLTVWDAASGRRVWEFDVRDRVAGKLSEVRSVTFSAGARLLASSSGDDVRVWDVGSGQQVMTLATGIASVRSVVFSPNGAWLAVSDSDEKVQLWQSADTAARVRLPAAIPWGDITSALQSGLRPNLVERFLDGKCTVATPTLQESALLRDALSGATSGVSEEALRMRWTCGAVDSTSFSGRFTRALYPCFAGLKAVAPAPSMGAPRYPDILRSAGVEGEVVAQFVVDTLGRVELGSYRVIRTSHDLFTASLRAALPAMRFVPAEVCGRRVRQLVQQPFVFSLQR